MDSKDLNPSQPQNGFAPDTPLSGFRKRDFCGEPVNQHSDGSQYDLEPNGEEPMETDDLELVDSGNSFGHGFLPFYPQPRRSNIINVDKFTHQQHGQLKDGMEESADNEQGPALRRLKRNRSEMEEGAQNVVEADPSGKKSKPEFDQAVTESDNEDLQFIEKPRSVSEMVEAVSQEASGWCYRSSSILDTSDDDIVYNSAEELGLEDEDSAFEDAMQDIPGSGDFDDGLEDFIEQFQKIVDTSTNPMYSFV